MRGSRVDGWPALKKEGNEAFKKGKWEEAVGCYTAAIAADSWMKPEQRAVLYVNRAAVRLKQVGTPSLPPAALPFMTALLILIMHAVIPTRAARP